MKVLILDHLFPLLPDAAVHGPGNPRRCEVECVFSPSDRLAFSFDAGGKSVLALDESPSAWVNKLPVYFPTCE